MRFLIYFFTILQAFIGRTPDRLEAIKFWNPTSMRIFLQNIFWCDGRPVNSKTWRNEIFCSRNYPTFWKLNNDWKEIGLNGSTPPTRPAWNYLCTVGLTITKISFKLFRCCVSGFYFSVMSHYIDVHFWRSSINKFFFEGWLTGCLLACN